MGHHVSVRETNVRRVELVSAEVNVTQPGEISQYLDAFERLDTKRPS